MFDTRRSRRRSFTIAASLLLASGITGTSAQAQVAPPDLFKSFDPSTIGPGSTSTLTFSILNSGPSASDLAFTDPLPAALTIADPPSITNSCEGSVDAVAGGTSVDVTGGRVAGGGSCEISVDVTASAVGLHTNVTGDLSSSNGTSAAATADLAVATDLPGFTKSFAPNPVDLGERSTLTFTIDNSANTAPLTAASFVDPLPNGLVVASPANVSTTCPGTVTAAPGSGSVALAFFGNVLSTTIPAGSTCTLAVDVIADGAGSGELANATDDLVVTVDGQIGSSGGANATLDVLVADLHITKDFTDDPVAPGATANLQFSITNFDRSSTANAVTFTDDLDAALSGLASVAPLPTDPCGAGSSLTGTSTLVLTGGTIAPGATCTFDVTVAVPAAAGGTSVNTTSAVAGSVDGVATEGNSATDTLFVVAAPQVTKTFTPDAVTAGGSVTLEFTIENIDSDPITDIVLVDVLDDILSNSLVLADVCGGGSSLSITVGQFDAPTVTLLNGSLGAGESCTFSVPLDVAPAAPAGLYPNETDPVTATVGGVPVAGGSASDTLAVVAAPRLDKEFTDDPTRPGDDVTLAYTLSNGGGNQSDVDVAGPIDDITFTDDLSFLAGLTATGVSPPTDPCGPGSTVGFSNLDKLVTLTDGALGEFESCTFEVTISTSASTPQGTSTSTTSDVSATSLGVAVSGPGASDDLTVTDITFTKEFTDDPVIAGSPVTLAFTITNASATLDATDVTFSDSFSPVLSGLTFTSLDSDTCGGTSSSTATFFTYAGGVVSAGSSCTIEVTLGVPANAVPDSYRNTTSVLQASIGTGSIVIPPATDELVVTPAPDIDLVKEFTDDPVGAGETTTLRFSLSNPSAIAISDVGFSDDLDAVIPGLAAGSLPISACGGTLDGSVGNTMLTFSGGTLAAGEQCAIDVVLSVPAGTPPGTYLNSTSTVTGTALGQPVVGDPATAELTISSPVEQRADLSISKVDSVDPVVAGSEITYTIEVANAGPEDAIDVVVDDTLPFDVDPAGNPLHLVSLVNTVGCANDPVALICELGDIPAGGSASYTLTVLVLPGTDGTITNEVTVSAATQDPDRSNNTATETTEVLAEADLSITKTDSIDPVTAGTSLAYTIEVTNAGPAPALDVAVTDVLPIGVSNAVTAGCAEDGAGVPTCTLGDIAPNASASFTLTVDVDPGTLGTITNTASVTAFNTDPDPSDNSITEETVVVASADLDIVKVDSADPTPAGGDVTYTVTVGNAGPSDAVNVVVTDVLPAGVSNATTTGCAEDDAGVPTCSLGTIPAGGSAQYTITVATDPAAADGTVLTNTASVGSDTGDPDPSNNSASQDTTLVVEADLSIEKVDDVDPVRAHSSERLVYTVTVTNEGPSDATGLIVTDTLPAGVKFKETVGCDEGKKGVPTCTLGDLTAGSSVSYTIEVKMRTQTPPGVLVNTASVTSTSNDPDLSNNTTTEDTLACTFQNGVPDDCGQVAPLSPTFSVVSSAPSPAAGEPPTTPDPLGQTLPATGSSGSNSATLMALMVLALGCGLWALGRPRRRTSAT